MSAAPETPTKEAKDKGKVRVEAVPFISDRKSEPQLNIWSFAYHPQISVRQRARWSRVNFLQIHSDHHMPFSLFSLDQRRFPERRCKSSRAVTS